TDAVRAFRAIKEFRDVPLEIINGNITLPYAPLPDEEEAKINIDKYAHAADSWGSENAEWNYWNAVLEAHKQPLQTARIFAQTITQLGPLAIVPFPGEVFSEIALRIKKHSPLQHTLCTGTCNGHYGYL